LKPVVNKKAPPVSDWAEINLGRLRMAIIRDDRELAEELLGKLLMRGVNHQPDPFHNITMDSWVSEMFEQRQACALEAQGIFKIHQLYKTPYQTLLSFPRFGEGTVEAIEEILVSKFGRRLDRTGEGEPN